MNFFKYKLNHKNPIFLYTFSILLAFCFLLTGCSSTNHTNDALESARQYEEYLISQMEPIINNYTITNRNSEEIVLQNYSLGRIEIYDKYGTQVAGFLVESKTVYYNWYEIEKNDNGLIQINLSTIDRAESYHHFYNGELYVLHDRALQINLSPYENLMFASLNGDEKYRNSSYEFETSEKIKYPVKTDVTEFEISKIINITEGSWNSSHTLQFCTYEISLLKVIFDDTTYEKAGIMEYRFSVQGTVDEDLYSIYETGEIKGT